MTESHLSKAERITVLPFFLSSRKRQIKGRVDRYEKIVVERIEMFHHY